MAGEASSECEPDGAREVAEARGKLERAESPLPPWLCPGLSVEVRMQDSGLIGSRYTARVVQVSGKEARVRFDAFSEDGSDEPLCEWLPASSLVPLPPPTPSSFLLGLQVGAHHKG